MSSRQIYSTEDFMRWADSLKPCKYCPRKFVGPVCECERLRNAERFPRRKP